MSNILLGTTGSFAAIKVPQLYQTLIDAGHSVRIVATEPSLAFFDPTLLPPTETTVFGTTHNGPVFRDADEWKPHALMEKGDPVLHIEFRRWADLFLIAPLDANTLAKLAIGLADNFLTTVFRAWDFSKPVILAPAMNTFMWQSAVTLRHLRQIVDDHRDRPSAMPDGWTLDQAADAFASASTRMTLVPPGTKRLACGDVGIGAMAEVPAIAETVREILQI